MIKEQRQVGFKTIFDLARQSRTLFSLGLIFTLIPFAIGGVFLLVFSLIGEEVPKVDYEQISRDGKTAIATITNIRAQENISINTKHPSIISYKYIDGKREIESKYRSLAPDQIDRMNIGDTIQVKYLADSSIIIGLEPFVFPFDFISILILFLIGGLVLLGFLYLKVNSKVNLYKNGEVRDAEIVSMTPRNGSSDSRIGEGVMVCYQYTTTRGQSILGESFTSDFAILNSKKHGDLIKIFVSVDNESKSCVISRLDQIRNHWKIE